MGSNRRRRGRKRRSDASTVGLIVDMGYGVGVWLFHRGLDYEIPGWDNKDLNAHA